MSWFTKLLGITTATAAVVGTATVVHQQPPSPPPAPPVTATLYDGLLYAEMGPIQQMLEKRGVIVKRLWHDQQEADTRCPEYIIGHSMGANAAVRQAIRCTVQRHRPPKQVILIDPGRCPGNSPCDVPETAGAPCINFYNPAHPIGGQFMYGHCKNVVVQGYDHLYMPDAPAVTKYIQENVK